MSPIIPSRYGHPKYNIFPQKTRATSSSGFKQSQRGTPGGVGSFAGDSKSSRRKQRIEENKITVQPVENGSYGDVEDGDNYFSKQLAAARFQRNHRLVNVLFSDVVVEQDHTTENDKLQSCKKRIQSLTEFQRKIDAEMVEMNEKFQAKKAKIIDDGKKFSEKLVDFVANSKKELEVLRAAQEVRRQQEAVRKQQAKAEAEAAALLNPPKPETSEKSIEQQKETTEEKDKETPMDIDKSGDSSIHKEDDVRLLLDSVIDSIANSI